VQTPDDEQFEAYLKRFRPICLEPVPRINIGRSSRCSLPLGAWLAAVAAILVVGAIVLRVRDNRVVVPTASEHRPAPLALTLRTANAWFATAPSFKAAVDGLAFHPQTNPVPQGKQSAVSVLGKEKIKL
jgi:hypothetical protein